MNYNCKNCGGEIRISIFKGGEWCCENCRKELVQKSRMKCEYPDVWSGEVGVLPICTVHGRNSKYPPTRGEHRPCLAIEPYDYEDEFSWQ